MMKTQFTLQGKKVRMATPSGIRISALSDGVGSAFVKSLYKGNEGCVGAEEEKDADNRAHGHLLSAGQNRLVSLLGQYCLNPLPKVFILLSDDCSAYVLLCAHAPPDIF